MTLYNLNYYFIAGIFSPFLYYNVLIWFINYFHNNTLKKLNTTLNKTKYLEYPRIVLSEERLTDNMPIDTLSSSLSSNSSNSTSRSDIFNTLSNSTSSTSVQTISSDFEEDSIMVNNFMIENELDREIQRQVNSRRNSELITPTRRNSLLPPIRSYLTYVQPINDNSNNISNDDTIQLLPIERTTPRFTTFLYDTQDRFRDNSSEA